MVEKTRTAVAPQTLIKLPPTVPTVPSAPPADVSTNAADAATKTADGAWTATGAVDSKTVAAGLVPIDVQAQKTAAAAALERFSPVGITGVDPLQALDGIKDGKVTLTVPLAAGEYNAGKANFAVKEGTVVHVEVTVKDGHLVASRDAKGKPIADGSNITIDPPIGGISVLGGKLKLPVKLDGLYVKEGKAKKGQTDPEELVKLNIGHFFDLTVADLKNPTLGDAVRTLTAIGQPKNPPAPQSSSSATPATVTTAATATATTPSAPPPPAPPAKASKPDKHAKHSLQDLVALDKVSFNAQVTMSSDAVNLGPSKIQLAPGSQLSVSGDAQHATLDGQLNIQSATFKHPQLQATIGASSAHLHADYTAAADGTMRVQAQLSGFNPQIDDLTMQQAAAPGGGEPDHVHLTNTALTNGQLDFDATLVPVAGSRLPQLKDTSMRMKGHAEGYLADAKLTSPDPANPAVVTIDASRFSGDIDLGPGGHGIDATITGGAHLHDGAMKNGSASAQSLSADFAGTIGLKSNPAEKSFSMNVNAKQLNIALDGYRATTAGQTIDIKHFDAEGPVNFSVDSSGRISADGNLGFHLQPNELKVGTPGQSIDLGQSTVSGSATRLRGGGQPLELTGSVAFNAKVNQIDLATAQVSVEGAGQLKGQADLTLGAQGAGVVLKNAHADLSTQSGHVGTATTPMGLDLTGGKASLDIQEARYGTAAAGGLSVNLGKSKVSATVANGHITVKGQPISLENAHVELDVDRASEKPGESPTMKGHLTLTATVGAAAINHLALAGVTLSQSDAAKGTVTIKVPDVTLDGSGHLSVQNAQFALDAQVGKLKKGAAPSASPSTPLTGSPAGVVSQATVDASTPAQLAGVKDAQNTAAAIDPLELVKNVKQGNVQLTIPFQGKVGEGWASVDFPKGSSLKLNLVVVNGALVPDKTSVELIQPGKQTIRGYLAASKPSLLTDAKNDLRRLVGKAPEQQPVEYGLHVQMPLPPSVDRVIDGSVVATNTVLRTNIPVPGPAHLDVAVPLLQHLPLNLNDFVSHLQAEGRAVSGDVETIEGKLGKGTKAPTTTPTGSASAAKPAAPAPKTVAAPVASGSRPTGTLAQLEAAIQVNATQVDIDGTVGGTIRFPGGSIDLANDTNVKLKGTPTGAHLEAHVDINAMKVATPDLYLDGGKGGGDLSIDWKNGVASIDLKNLRGALNKSVVKAGASYVSLGASQASGASVHVEVPLAAPNLSDPKALAALRDTELGAAKQNLQTEISKATFDITSLDGQVIGGRFAYPNAGGVMTTELSGALNGGFHFSGGEITANGRITNADLGLSGLKGSTTLGSGEVGAARMKVSGSFGVSSKGVQLAVTGQFAGQASGQGRDGRAAVKVTGSGTVQVNGTNLSISDGKLHVEGTASSQTTLPTKALSRPATQVNILRPNVAGGAN